MFNWCRSDNGGEVPRNTERKPLNQTETSYDMGTLEGNPQQVQRLEQELEQEKEKK